MSQAPDKSTLNGKADDFAKNLLLFERMEAVLTQRLLMQPDNENLLFQLAGCKRKQGKLSGALERYEELSQRFPENPAYRFAVNALSGGFSGVLPDSIPQPHISPIVQFSDFLDDKTIQDTLDYVYQHQEDFRPAATMNADKKPCYNNNMRNNTDLNLKGHPLKKTVRKNMWNQLPSIQKRLGLEAFDIGKIEVQLRAYHHGEYFRTHHDDMSGRRINFVYFFYPQPKRYQGGELVIFDTNTTNKTFNHEFTRIIPFHNQIVFFPSNYFHAVLPAILQDANFLSGRFAINGHVRKREG